MKYTLKTIQSIGLIKINLLAILQPIYTEGFRKFYILGESDLSTLIDSVLKENHLNDCELKHIKDRSQASRDGVILVCTEEEPGFAERKVREDFLPAHKQKDFSMLQEINLLECLASQA